MANEPFIERNILIGCITSTEYLAAIHDKWNIRYIQSPTAKILAGWCLAHFKEYKKAPGRDIENIFFDKLKKGKIQTDIAHELEEDILPDMSDEYERQDKFNSQYLIDKTWEYFSERSLELHQEEVEALKDEGKIQEAEKLMASYRPLTFVEDDATIDLANPDSIDRVLGAFKNAADPILTYPGALGEYMNPHLVRDSLIAFLAPEKRGKSFWLMDMCRRGAKQRLNVALFQAGDMSEPQMLRRLGIHLAKRSDMEQYAGEQWEPVKDCIKHQAGTCTLAVREKVKVEIEEYDEEELRDGLPYEALVDLAEEYPKWRPCHNCKAYKKNKWGCAWLKKVDVGPPLEMQEAGNLFKEYFVDKKRNFRIATFANDTLTIDQMDAVLDKWFEEGFIPDLIALDYADLLTGSAKDFRQLQNEIWKGLRRISTERHSLLATATQADADSYERGTLSLKNFSEDKRKFSHVNSMFGLNQDPQGRERRIGIMRINCLIARENPAHQDKVVHVLQNLRRGQPVLTSYW